MPEFNFCIKDIEMVERKLTFRMPFRFGVVTLDRATESYVRSTIELPSGNRFFGVSADLMAPKWFDKNLELSNDQNVDQLRQSLAIAKNIYLSGGGLNTAFGFHSKNSSNQYEECLKAGLNGLIAGFGSSLVDRSLLDAICRATGLSFFESINANIPSIDYSTTPDLKSFDISKLLSKLKAPNRIKIRHTVGLSDAITDKDLLREDIPNDHLPFSLAGNCKFYGLRAFKIKISGDLHSDTKRLLNIANVLNELTNDFSCSLDGNEQFECAEDLQDYLKAVSENKNLYNLMSKLDFIEQPIRRKTALSRNLGDVGTNYPIEIDESDSEMSSFLQAKDLGYRGISSKSCKGVYRSLLNRCRVEKWNSESPSLGYFMTAEDLSTQAGTAVQQDVSLASLIGCKNVEKNGHQYGDGLASLTNSDRESIARCHPDLYELDHPRLNLKINDGYISLQSLAFPGYGTYNPPNLF